jgi:putative NADH-flavin reductase
VKLTVFAATGGIGREILAQAVAAGHEVTAAVRDPSRLGDGANGAPPLPPARVVTCDLASPDPAAMRSAVGGADAVLSGLGPRIGRDAVGIASSGTQAIVRAVQEAGVRRVIVVSAAPVSTVPSPGRPDPPRHDPGEGPVMRHVLTPLTRVFLGRHYADLALMEDVLRDSGLDWTSVRPPRLTNGPLTGRYRMAIERNLRGGLRISRADVAQAMLAALHQPETVGHAVGVAR